MTNSDFHNIVNSISNIKTLKELIFNNNKFDTDIKSDLANLQSLENIQIFGIGGNSIGDRGVQSLSLCLRNWYYLKTLYINSIFIILFINRYWLYFQRNILSY